MSETMLDRIRRGTRGAVAVAAAVFLVAAAASPAVAQDGAGEVSFDPRVGFAFPIGDLADTHEVGFAAGGGLAVGIHRNFALRGDVDVSVLDDVSPVSGTVLAPTLTMVHYHGGVEVDFDRPSRQDIPFTLRWAVGAGATSMSATRDFADGQNVDFTATYPSVNSSLKLGIAISENMELYAGGQLFLTFTDETETAELVKRVPGLEPYSTAWSAPVTLGLKASF